jgi:hypothetical protein
MGVQSISLVFFCLFYFYDQLVSMNDNSPTIPLTAKIEFWIIAGILIYKSSTFFLQILSNSLTVEQKIYYWNFLYVANIVKNLFFCIGIYIAARKNTPTKLT